MAPSIDEPVILVPGAVNGNIKVNGYRKGLVNGHSNVLVNGLVDGLMNGLQDGPIEYLATESGPPNGDPNTESFHGTARLGSPRSTNSVRFTTQEEIRPTSSVSCDHTDTFQTPEDNPRTKTRTQSWGDEVRDTAYPRISKPLELMRNSYDCVVIGSGYGGGVAASRMARAGLSVCLLERGKERWPGEYPTDPKEVVNQLHFSGEITPGWLPKKVVNGGDPTAMYHMIFGHGQNAFVCNGLGGTSLVNANVFLEANTACLSQGDWPEEIRSCPEEMTKYYEKAAEMLEPEPYPTDWPSLPKMDLLQRQAECLNMGHKFKRVRQTTRFTNGPNKAGVEMLPSQLTGQDLTGINDGSKNSTLVTYLADAWNWGAEMFCEAEVRYITKAPGREGYIVYFAWHGRNRGHFKANLHGDLLWVYARKAVFLGAGAIGSTEILLRSREMGLSMSSQVGQNLSGNGDMLAFGYNTKFEANAMGSSYPSPYNPVGPCITGIIDNREGHSNPLNGFVIEEGVVPQALAPFLQTMLELLPGQVNPEERSLFDRVKSHLARAGSLFLGPYYRKGAIERTQTYLIMSHDSNQATLTLKEDKPVLEFLGVGRSEHVKYINRLLAKATRAVGGTFVENPFYALLQEQEITVHPIGGACMASNGKGTTGATNHCGELFVGESHETHPGLIVCDAALIPTALGANPLATITALAERSVDLYTQREGLEIDTTPNGILDLFGSPKYSTHDRHQRRSFSDDEDREECTSITSTRTVIQTAERLKDAGFGFTEVMSGFIHCDEGLKSESRETYELAARIAESRCEAARFFLSVQSFNVRSIINDPDHGALLTGTFSCPTLPGSPFMVHRGDFNLFRQYLEAPGTRNLVYNFDMRGVNGKALHFRGYKVVDSSVALAPFQFWRATSTLYVTISEHSGLDGECPTMGDESSMRGRIIAKGIMKIQPQDFVSQILTMTPTGSSLFKKARSAASFFSYFTHKSISLFLSPLTPLQYPIQSYNGYINETPSHIYPITASDGVSTRMHRFDATHMMDKAKILFMIPGASVDHQIFALPTIKYNAMNYFTRAGYTVYVPVHRIGLLMEARKEWTTFDARLDLKACLEKIREEHGPKKVYTIAHCMGSVALSAGLLEGTIPASWIAGITCSQVFFNPEWNTMNMIKIMAAPIPLDKAYRALAGSWFSCSTNHHNDSWVQRLLNEALRFMPDERREMCSNATCHRVSLTFGRCWNHANLNEATHRQIDRFFGGVNMTLLHLLMKQGYEGGIMSNAPLYERLDTRDNIARLEGIPIFLFSGRDNAVLSTTSTETTYEVLCDTFGTHGRDDQPAAGGKHLNGQQESGFRRRKKDRGPTRMYKRRVVPDYGHLDCWMGRNAWRDVFPFVREEVDRVMRGEDYVFEEPHDKFWRMIQTGELRMY